MAPKRKAKEVAKETKDKKEDDETIDLIDRKDNRAQSFDRQSL